MSRPSVAERSGKQGRLFHMYPLAERYRSASERAQMPPTLPLAGMKAIAYSPESQGRRPQGLPRLRVA
jgi:hypothetical protein